MKTAIFGLILSIATANTPVFASAPTSIDAADIQHFEQTYEEWVQSLAQSIAPTIPATVLVELDYSNSPEKLQTYEELRAANHLPGLPEVTDPNFTYPSESPLYALVNQQRIKIIFEHDINANQRKILTEVLNTKLKINSARGDQLVFDHVNETASLTKSIPMGKKQAALFILLALAGLVILSVKRTQNANSNEGVSGNLNSLQQAKNNLIASIATSVAAAATSVAQSATAQVAAKAHANVNSEENSLHPKTSTAGKKLVVPPVFRALNDKEKIAEEKTLIKKMHHQHPRVFSQASKITNPVQIILKSNPRRLIETVRNETAESIATAVIHSPESFSSTLLQVCTKEQLVAVKNILRTQKNKISDDKSKYAQLLLAAKINFESNLSQDSNVSEANL